MSRIIRENASHLIDGVAHYGQAPFFFTAYPGDREARLRGKKYIILIVLTGTARCEFTTARFNLEEGTLLAFEASELKHFICTDGTILLEYQPPRRMALMLEQCFKAFHTSYSDFVAVDERMHRFCRPLLRRFFDNLKTDADYLRQQRKEFTQILKSYTAERLGNLYVPFHACTVCNDDCDQCDL